MKDSTYADKLMQRRVCTHFFSRKMTPQVLAPLSKHPEITEHAVRLRSPTVLSLMILSPSRYYLSTTLL